MKKIIFFWGFAFAIIVALQSCDCLCGSSSKPVGVIQFDSTGTIIKGYDWEIVDTAGGFTTIPLGFRPLSDGTYKPVLKEKESKWVDGMLLTFQKQYKVKITDYRLLFIKGIKQAYVTVFFEPTVDPTIQKLKKAYQESIDQNQELNDLVDDLSASNRQMKKEFQKLKKTIEDDNTNTEMKVINVPL